MIPTPDQDISIHALPLLLLDPNDEYDRRGLSTVAACEPSAHSLCSSALIVPRNI
jgi:hypothetical protein